MFLHKKNQKRLFQSKKVALILRLVHCTTLEKSIATNNHIIKKLGYPHTHTRTQKKKKGFVIHILFLP